MTPALKRLSAAALLALTLAPAAQAQSGAAMIDQSSPTHVADITGALTRLGFTVTPIEQSGPWAFLAEYKGSKLVVLPEGCSTGKGCRFLIVETRYNFPTGFDAADIEEFNRRSYCCKMVQPEPGRVFMSMSLPFGQPMTEAYFTEAVTLVYAMHGRAFKLLRDWHERGPRSAAAAPAAPAPGTSAPAPKTPGLGIGKAEIGVSAPKDPPSLGVGVGSFALEELMR